MSTKTTKPSRTVRRIQLSLVRQAIASLQNLPKKQEEQRLQKDNLPAVYSS